MKGAEGRSDRKASSETDREKKEMLPSPVLLYLPDGAPSPWTVPEACLVQALLHQLGGRVRPDTVGGHLAVKQRDVSEDDEMTSGRVMSERVMSDVGIRHRGPLGTVRSHLCWTETDSHVGDIESYTNCSLTAPLDADDSAYSIKIQKYFAMLESHIDPAFLKAVPELLAHMKSQDVVAVFVPASWTGLLGVTPVALEFTADLPKSMKPKARHINPKLEAEWKRHFLI